MINPDRTQQIEQMAFDFFNYNYIDWQLVEMLISKKQMTEDEKVKAIEVLTALWDMRERMSKAQ
jgi:hypothetical protein